jgi:hypothetical protein
MDDILSAIFLEEKPSRASYEVTLAQLLVERQVRGEWRPARPDAEYEPPYLRLFPVLPFDEIAAFAAAWERLVSAAAEHGLVLRIGAQSREAPRQQLPL